MALQSLGRWSVVGGRWCAPFGAVLLLLAAGCDCGTRTKKNNPIIEVIYDDGTARTSVDFGLVQVNTENTVDLRVRNSGTTPLTISALTTAAPFGTKTAVPLTIAVGEERAITVSFTPTEPDVHKTGTLAIASDDSAHPTTTIDLAGTGIQAVAVASPDPVDFKDVYVDESAKITVSLTNAGSNDLDVQSVAPASGTDPAFTFDPAALQKKIPSGQTAKMDVTFAPKQMGNATGGATLTLPASQGGAFTIPFKGRGVRSETALCFKYDDTGVEQCSDPDAGPATLNLAFGSLCDNRLYPPDSGAAACTSATGQRSGELYLRNSGNIQVRYSLQYQPYGDSPLSRCDAGDAPEKDFSFSNEPTDGGFIDKYSVSTTALPANPNDPQPWQTAPVKLTYRATSRCRAEGADQAFFIVTRQSELPPEPAPPIPNTRTPQTIVMVASGQSRLPYATPIGWHCGAVDSTGRNCVSTQAIPCKAAFMGAGNAGDAPLNITSVDLYEEIFWPDGGIPDAGGPNGGFFQPCAFAGQFSDCNRFAWERVDGGDPNSTAPHTLGPADSGFQTSAQIGSLVFGPTGYKNCTDPDGGICPNKVYRLWAVVKTSDPYAPQVFARIDGCAAP